MKKTLLQKFGLLGILSFLSYTAAVVFLSIASLTIIIIAGAKIKIAVLTAYAPRFPLR